MEESEEKKELRKRKIVRHLLLSVGLTMSGIIGSGFYYSFYPEPEKPAQVVEMERTRKTANALENLSKSQTYKGLHILKETPKDIRNALTGEFDKQDLEKAVISHRDYANSLENHPAVISYRESVKDYVSVGSGILLVPTALAGLSLIYGIVNYFRQKK